MNGNSNTDLTVFQKQLQMVYRIAYTYLGSRTEAENTAQEVFVRLFRSGLGLDNERVVKGWLAAKVTELCLKKLNDPSYTVNPAPDGHELDETMQAVMALPGKYKTVAYLFYYEGRTAAETAELMGDEPEITRSIIGRLHRTMAARLGEEEADYESAYDRIRIDANSAVKIWKNILSIQQAIDEMLKKQSTGSEAPSGAQTQPLTRGGAWEAPTVEDDEDDEDEDDEDDDEDDDSFVQGLFAPEEDDEQAESEPDEYQDESDEDMRIFTPRAESRIEEPAPGVDEPEESAPQNTEEFNYLETEIGLESELPAESFNWGDLEEESLPQDSAESVLEELYDEEISDEAPDEERAPTRSASAHRAHRHRVGKKRGSILPAVLIGALIAAAAAFLLFNLFRGEADDSGTGSNDTHIVGAKAASGQSESIKTNSATSVVVETQAPVVYEGKGDGVKKVKAIQTALGQWTDYLNAQRRAYFEENLPEFTQFMEVDSTFDGTDVVENGDGTYSFIHWIYDEDWGNMTVSALTGQEEPSLIQRFDYENSVTVEEAEYKRFAEYVMAQEELYGDYHSSYGVKNEADASKLEEIAEKASLTLRYGSGESMGYGEMSDKELADKLAERVCSGTLFNTEPQIDYIDFYDAGAFDCMAELRLEDGRRMYTLLCASPYTEMVDAAAAAGIYAQKKDMSAREYTAADGTKLAITQSEEQAIVYAYLDNYYAVLDMSINAWREAPDMNDSEQERAAKRETNMKLDDAAVNYVCDAIAFSSIGK